MSHIDITHLLNAERARAAAGKQSILAMAIPIEVEEYQSKYKPDFDIEVQPVKTVVVSQDPKKGETVPQGTEVTVVMAPRNSLPLEIFNLDEAITNTYGEQKVEVLMEDLEKKGPATKAILAQDKKFEELGGDEKDNVKKYAEENLGYTGGDAALEKLYDDLKFIHNF